MSIEISEDVLWARIGRLTVENDLLRARVAELEARVAAAAPEPEAVRP
jgi:BMFP domain-containing protein YqiC